MPAYNRIDRISEEVKRELSMIIRELKDPRIPLMTSVVNVKVANDLKVAKAYISVMGDEKTKNDCIAALKNAQINEQKNIAENKLEKQQKIENTIEITQNITENTQNNEKNEEFTH